MGRVAQQIPLRPPASASECRLHAWLVHRCFPPSLLPAHTLGGSGDGPWPEVPVIHLGTLMKFLAPWLLSPFSETITDRFSPSFLYRPNKMKMSNYIQMYVSVRLLFPSDWQASLFLQAGLSLAERHQKQTHPSFSLCKNS